MSARRGRPHQGAELVEKLEDGTEVARQRLKVIFQTMSGVFTVEQACQILQINRSAFNKLRSQFLANAVQLLEPKTPGRKKKVVTEQEAENQRLVEENRRLRFELRAQQLREEIGLLMPHLLKDDDRSGPGKKTRKKTR